MMPDPDAPAEMPPPDLTGRTLGDFQVLRKIGQGGMGQVYLARQLSLKREVALKLLRNDLAANPTALKRFQGEAEAIARISHPNIVQVYAIGEHEGLRYMALEYVEGRNLRDFLTRKGAPDLPVALAIMRQVAAALQRASELGIVHRDIKPENILLTKKVEVKVTDFGLSRLTGGDQLPLNLTQSGVTLGTQLYMAPEQVRGQATDHRSDIYSFGVTCYHILAGLPPFTGANAIDVAMKHVNERPEPLGDIRTDLPADLCAMVHKMMAKKPSERYQTAKEILRDLSKVREGLSLGLPNAQSGTLPQISGSFSGPTQTYVMALPPSPARWPAYVLGFLVLAGTFTGGWWLFGKLHPRVEAASGPPVIGLPDVRLPETVTLASTKERELTTKLHVRGTKPNEVVDASIELGLLLMKERRFVEAGKVFVSLENEKFDLKGVFAPHVVAAKLGQGILLAQQDKAKESIEAFKNVVAIIPKSGNPKNPGPGMIRFNLFLREHRELSQAVAEAIQRDADNLKGEKFPTLDFLRSPPAMIRPS